MKKIYSFSLKKEEIVKEEHKSVDPETQEDITITKDVKKAVEKKFFLKNPTRPMHEKAEFFYNQKHCEAVREGVMPFALIQKRIKEDGGFLSEKQEKEYTDLLNKILEKRRELELKKSTSEEIKRETEKDLNKLEDELREIQNLQFSLFQNSAEGYARTKTSFFWVLMLSHFINDKNEELPFFGDGNYEDKLKKYDEMEEAGDPFVLNLIEKFTYYVSLWYNVSPKDEADFIKALEIAEKKPYGAIEEEKIKEEIAPEAQKEKEEKTKDSPPEK